MMSRFCLFLLVCAFVVSPATAFWPFSSGDSDADDEKTSPRLSELMEPASLAIDEASDLMGDGKSEQAIEKYREALSILEKLEADNPDRASTPEFASVRNKRAYVSAAIDSILMAQARENARAVAITDTTGLESRLRERMSGKGTEQPRTEYTSVDKEGNKVTRIQGEKPKKGEKPVPAARRERLLYISSLIDKEKYDKAEELIEALLDKDPNDLSALSLKALMETSLGEYKAADATLTRALAADPQDYHAYYNRARLQMEGFSNAAVARRLYEAGRRVGGPADPEFEKELGSR